MKKIPVTQISVFEFDCQVELVDRIHSSILDLEKNKKIIWDDIGGYNDSRGKMQNHSQIGHLQSEPRIPYYDKELFTWFSECTNNVGQHLFQQNLNIVDTWLTKTNFMNYIRPHEHKCSILSGVFYFSGSKSSNIQFKIVNPVVDHYKVFFTKDMNETISVKADKGKLIIFPSFLFHSVPTNSKINETRYSLAFNAFFSGLISTQRSGYLNLDINPIIPELKNL